jgi:hypothetical protein
VYINVIGLRHSHALCTSACSAFIQTLKGQVQQQITTRCMHCRTNFIFSPFFAGLKQGQYGDISRYRANSWISREHRQVELSFSRLITWSRSFTVTIIKGSWKEMQNIVFVECYQKNRFRGRVWPEVGDSCQDNLYIFGNILWRKLWLYF